MPAISSQRMNIELVVSEPAVADNPPLEIHEISIIQTLYACIH